MKKYVLVLLALAAALFVSCNNVIEPLDNPDNQSQAPVVEGKTITFSATIDAAPNTKASLDGLNIKWSSGDYIGVATDNSATIVAYQVKDISSDGLSCSLEVNAVEGAQTYYAVFKGSLGASGDHADQAVAANNFSAISFNTSTKTFSGLTVGSQQVAEAELSSHLWYENGYPLSMAGKSSGNTLVMKPCLALVKIQIDEESVPSDAYIVSETYNNPVYNVNHSHSYSAVRGFNLEQVSSPSRPLSGDFSVQISDENVLTVSTVGDGSSREKGGSAKLSADTPYYMCVIPGGSVSSFRIKFWGYKDNQGTVNWDAAAYIMNLTKNITIGPGDCIDLGTLNPLGRKKAKNHADDDAADAEAAFDPDIDVDGDIDDWDDVSHTFTANCNGLKEWKYTTDERNLYLLYKVATTGIVAEGSSFDNSPYFYVGFDTDNNASTGGTAGGNIGAGQEVELLIRPWTGASSETPQCEIGNDENGHIKQYSNAAWTELSDKLKIGAKITGDYCYVEVRVPLSILGNPTGPVKVNHSFRWALTGATQIMPEATSITAEDQEVLVEQTVAIGATTNSTANITYTSNDPSVATVDSDGVITGVAAGTTTITLNVAAVNGEYASATKDINVTVTAPYIPAIEIDGDMSDWDPDNNNQLTDGSNYIATVGNGTYWKEFKFAYDERYFYFYAKRNYNTELWDGGYFWFKFDTNGDENYEDDVKFYIMPFTTVDNVYSFLATTTARDVKNTASSSFTVSCAGIYNTSEVEIEVKALRSDIGINTNTVISIQSNANKSAGTITIPGTLTINN